MRGDELAEEQECNIAPTVAGVRRSLGDCGVARSFSSAEVDRIAVVSASDYAGTALHAPEAHRWNRYAGLHLDHRWNRQLRARGPPRFLLRCENRRRHKYHRRLFGRGLVRELHDATVGMNVDMIALALEHPLATQFA